MRLEWFVARHYLSSRKKGRTLLSLGTFIAISGVAVGVMALLVVIAVMTGLQRELQAKILTGAPHIVVFEEGTGLRLGNWRNVLARVQDLPGVVAVTPTVRVTVMIARNRDYVQSGLLFGVQPSPGQEPVTEVERGLLSGDYSLGPEPRPAGALPGLLIGRQLAARLAVLPGDTVFVGTIENIDVGPLGDLMPTLRQFEVTGTVSTGMFEYDNVYLYARLEDVQDLLDLPPDTIGMLGINVADPWQARESAVRIRDELGYPYMVDTWMELNATLFSALRLEKLAMAIILSLIIVVAAFNIVSMLTMVVADKRREIGILKSMGMTDGTVLRIFMLQGVAIGGVGTLIGGTLGLALVWLIDRYEFITLPGDVYFLDTLPVALDPFDVLLIGALSVLIAFGATIYPALQASRLQPVEAIRDD